tara:strand:- start:833 stop:1393 length:561 start_codon:yes stop_codon:yes gene_type:complete
MRNNDKDLSSEQKKELKENESEIPLNSAENEEEDTDKSTEQTLGTTEVDQLEEKLLRAQAEIQNLRRISQNELIKARLYGSENLVKDLIPSIDNLFRTLENQDTENKTVPSEGVSLIVREMVSALEKNGISIIDPIGEEFNPNEHEALSVTENEEEKPNIVLEVFQKGFKFKDRVIKPAMVVVNKK